VGTRYQPAKRVLYTSWRPRRLDAREGKIQEYVFHQQERGLGKWRKAEDQVDTMVDAMQGGVSRNLGMSIDTETPEKTWKRVSRKKR
jgi:hypothetical protein